MKGVNRITSLLPFLALVVLAVLLYAVFSQDINDPVEPRFSLLAPQLAAEPEGFARATGNKPAFDTRLLRLSPLTAFRVPTATQFGAPLGTENGAFTYNAQSYWEHNPFRRGYHTGDDLNGIGGQNSDLGDPVYATCDSLVVYRGTPSRGWGKVLITAHRLPSGELIQSVYAHLSTIEVSYNSLVARGQKIGEVGNAGGQYFAHLHFEIREGHSLHLGPGYLQTARQHRFPSAFLAPYLKREALFVPSLALSASPDWTDLKIKNPKAFSKILSTEESSE